MLRAVRVNILKDLGDGRVLVEIAEQQPLDIDAHYKGVFYPGQQMICLRTDVREER